MQEPPTNTLDLPVAAAQPDSFGAGPPEPPQRKPKLKKLRLAFVLLGLTMLAVISTVFGMLMAVASDLPALENQAEYRAAKNSLLYYDDPACKAMSAECELAALTGNQNRVLLDDGQISPYIKNAVIAIEDRRFYEHEGVDYRGIARALVQDVLRRRAAQGGSTITQQFVKNALSAQGDRSVFQKLREAALAYHLERKWSKQKILTQYLNTVYFGNGAYGVESAVRTYFGTGAQDETTQISGYEVPEDPGPAAMDVTPAQGALLAGIIASPSMYDPVQNPRTSTQRRNLVLQRMLEMGTITRAEYEEALRTPVPDAEEVHPPRPESEHPYFSSWVTQQLVDRYRPGMVFGGGLKIKTTIDPELQAAAEQSIAGRLGAVGPEASMVVIENRTGEIKAMVGGPDFDERPFNTAVNGHRQPGSAFKPFILVRALADGVSPDATFASQEKEFPVPNSKGEVFEVHNYEDVYYGVASLRAATAASDNSVFAELGLDLGTKRVARLARRMGIGTPISTNPAMTLGGLEEGVTPMEMAYAYSTIANKGLRVSGSLAPGGDGPVAIESVRGSGRDDQNERRTTRVFSEDVGELAQQVLSGVIAGGTGEAAEIGEFAFGKTGTTENYGDAWFVGSNAELSAAVWVGYPDGLVPMETEYLGGPVAGGTFPAEIWHDFMASWIGIRDARREARDRDDEDDETGEELLVAPSEPSTVAPPTDEETAPTEEDGADQPEGDSGGGGVAPEVEAPAEPEPTAPEAPAPTPPETPAPAPAPAPPVTPPPTPPTGGEGGAVAQ